MTRRLKLGVDGDVLGSFSNYDAHNLLPFDRNDPDSTPDIFFVYKDKIVQLFIVVEY